MKALYHWHPYLGWTKEPFTILTDHANLNRRTAHWHADLQEYNFKIKHILGNTNIIANTLSQPPRTDQGEGDNQSIVMIPPTRIHTIKASDVIPPE
jgi:hypothetical protein